MNHHISTKVEDNVYTIILNYPSKHNCIGREMLIQLKEKLDSVEHNHAIKVIVIRGAGDKAFSTGANLKEFESLKPQEISEWITLGNEVLNQLENISIPTLAVIQGYTYGGGLELALACDLRVATESSSFCAPELKRGWIPGWGGMARLRKLVGEAKAKEIIYLSEVYSAIEAMRLGILHRVYPSDVFSSEVQKLIASLGGLDPMAFKSAKAALSDPFRRTTGADLVYDTMATISAKRRFNQNSEH